MMTPIQSILSTSVSGDQTANLFKSIAAIDQLLLLGIPFFGNRSRHPAPPLIHVIDNSSSNYE
jgi:hypothetical protein